MAAILQVNFRWDVPEDVATGATAADAQPFADREDVVWKIWIRDPQTKTSGGVYLFRERPDAEAWGRALGEQLAGREGVSDYRATAFDIQEEPTRVTSGPVDVSISA
ncbi:YdhR family protein [Conexibacter sp. CPCC 206217]|uniref:YdhR family protein n=1 Tax=Conexibacter sp. CPCC 206217 TaxID=3064574 RepID=UPI0027177AB2|nr:YdhR family protein [Conexibacter sp. CPCC 206217]MDO8208820.1 YdhR family protein [Conexibacter sp. CPCC 206217]